VAVLPHFGTDLLARTPQPSVNKNVTAPLNVNDATYNANTSEFLGSKNISLTPYRMTEERFSEQGFLKGVGNVTNTETFMNTYLMNYSRVKETELLRLPMDKISLGYLLT
jgi:hypothetical protein